MTSEPQRSRASLASAGYRGRMCRNIRPLHNFAPPATDAEVHEAALQYVRKLSGSTRPSQANADGVRPGRRRGRRGDAAAARRAGDHRAAEEPRGRGGQGAGPSRGALRPLIGPCPRGATPARPATLRGRDHERVRPAGARASLRSPACPATSASPTCAATPWSSSPRTTSGPRPCRVAAPTGSPPTRVPVRRPAALPGRDPRGVDVVAGGRGGGLRRRRRRRRRPPADLVGRRRLPWLDAVGRRAGADLGRASRSAARPGRGTSRRTAARRGGATTDPLSDLALSGRLARRAAGHHPLAGVGVVEALPRRHGRQAVVGRRRLRRRSSGSLGGDRRPARVADAGRRTGSRSCPTTRAGATSTRWTARAATCAATPTTAPPARPRSTCATRARTARGWCTSRRASCGSSTPSTAPTRAAPRRPPRRPPHRPRAAPHHHRRQWLSRRRARPDRPHERRDRPRHRAPAHPPRRPRPHAARRSPASGPGSPSRWATTGPSGSTTPTARRPCAVAPVDPRADGRARAPVRYAGRRPGAASSPPRPDGRSVAVAAARRPAAARGPRGRRRRGSRELARGATARSPTWPGRPDCAVAGLRRPGRGGHQPDRLVRPADGVPVAGHRAAVRRRLARPSPRTAATWRSCPGAASTRSTTSTRST